jgi:hypothetical protein
LSAADLMAVLLDGYRGLGDAVLGALALEDSRPPAIKLAVREMPGSGSPRS